MSDSPTRNPEDHVDSPLTDTDTDTETNDTVDVASHGDSMRLRLFNIGLGAVGWYLVLVVFLSAVPDGTLNRELLAEKAQRGPRVPRGVSAFTHLRTNSNVRMGGLPPGVPGIAVPRVGSASDTASLRMLVPSYNTSDPFMWLDRRDSVIAAFSHAWKGYRTFAFGKDELQPLSKTGSDTDYGIGLTILDALDTAFLLEELDIFMEMRTWVYEHFSFRLTGRPAGLYVNVFETTIRALGGLLSAYALSGDVLFLKKARELADRLLGAFDTKTGLPLSTVDLRTGKGKASPSNNGACSTAEVGTLQLEFRYLSHLTGVPIYAEAVDKITKHMGRATTLDGLVPILISPQTGGFVTNNIRLGSRGDSYYEYLLKQYLQTNGSEPLFRAMYDEAVHGIKRHLVAKSFPNKFTFVGELREGKSGSLWPKMDHLVCFLPGTLALGATGGRRMVEALAHMTDKDHEDLALARELMRTCYEMYIQTSTGLSPEIAFFNTADNQQEVLKLALEGQALLFSDFSIHKNDKHNMLRPEAVESMFVLYRITGDNMYREWAWDVFQAMERYAKVESGGYASLHDVTDIKGAQSNKMESFFLSETVKYLYLMFDDRDLLSLEEWVFNTEAHPFPVVPKLFARGGSLPETRQFAPRVAAARRPADVDPNTQTFEDALAAAAETWEGQPERPLEDRGVEAEEPEEDSHTLPTVPMVPSVMGPSPTPTPIAAAKLRHQRTAERMAKEAKERAQDRATSTPHQEL